MNDKHPNEPGTSFELVKAYAQKQYRSGVTFAQLYSLYILDKNLRNAVKIAELMGDTEKMVLEVYNHIIQERESPAEIVSETFQIKTS